EAIDGREPSFRCTEIRQRGPFALAPEACHVPCVIHIAMARADKVWRDALRTQTIADLIPQSQSHANAQPFPEVEQWMAGRMRRA
ncbi:MAG TPA: transcriptional regulator, partial [Ktedonobacterales bacterium]|nr:transcriptional regulator [Ktedonobacterales bacterium]